MGKRSDQIKLSKAWNKAVVKKLPVSYKKDGIDYVDHTQVTQRLIALIPDVQLKAGSFIYDDYEDRKEDLKNFCTKNNLKDFSENEEYLLSFIQFPYSTTDFLKGLS